MVRRGLVAIAFIAALLLVAVLVQRTLLRQSIEPEAALEAAAVDEGVAPVEQLTPRAVLTEVSGLVELRGGNGDWHPARLGQALQVDDVIRTAPNAKAVLVLGENVVVDVAEATTLSIQQVSSTLSRVALDDGRVVSKVNEKADFRFRVEIRASKAIAESAAGEFGVLKRGSQPAAVAAKSGSVDLRGEGGHVRLKAGEMSTVSDSGTPAPPSKIPSSLFLTFAPTPVSSKSNIELSGKTSPGASVVVDGKRSTANAKGHFSQRVALKQGDNEILVVVEDPLGRKASATPKISVLAGPKVQGEVQW